MLKNVLQAEKKWYQVNTGVYTKEWRILEMVTTWVCKGNIFSYVNLFKNNCLNKITNNLVWSLFHI